MNWKQLFRSHLIDTKNRANFTTVFDINKYKSLMRVTETIYDWGPKEYLHSWELQGDEKYNGIQYPKEDIVYTFPNTLFWISRTHAINNESLEWKDCQLWNFIVVDCGVLHESAIWSSLDSKVLCHRIPEYLELGNVLQIKSGMLYWGGKTFDLSISKSYQSHKDSTSQNFELLNFYKISQPLRYGLAQMYRWKYEDTISSNILHILSIIKNKNKYNKLLTVVEYKNGTPLVVNVRHPEPPTPVIEGGEEYNTANVQIKHRYVDDNNWSWVVFQDPKRNTFSLFPPFEAPHGDLFSRQSVDVLPLVVLCALFTTLLVLSILFGVYPLL
jgi:hypothetical protein